MADVKHHHHVEHALLPEDLEDYESAVSKYVLDFDHSHDRGNEPHSHEHNTSDPETKPKPKPKPEAKRSIWFGE